MNCVFCRSALQPLFIIEAVFVLSALPKEAVGLIRNICSEAVIQRRQKTTHNKKRGRFFPSL